MKATQKRGVGYIALTLLVLALTLVMLVSCAQDIEFSISFMVDGSTYATVSTAGNESIRLPENPTKDGHTFEGWYWDNDIWDRPFTANSLLDAPLSANMSVYAKWTAVHVHTEVIDQAVPPTATTDGLTEGKHCETCNEVLVAQQVVPALLQGTSVQSAAMTLNGDTLSITLPNATTVFSFLEDITVPKDASYVVSRDLAGEQPVNNKTVSLNEGANTYYILVTNGNSQKLYTASIYRRPIYTVTFDVKGGSAVPVQYVEEGGLISVPTTTKAGYDFGGWRIDLTAPVTSPLTVEAQWNVVTYTVGYDLAGGSLQGSNPTQYTVENAPASLLSPTKKYYRFLGWYQGDTLIDSFDGLHDNLELVAKWECYFTVTGNTITGVSEYCRQNLDTIEIPGHIDGVEITAIGYRAFSGYEKLTSVSIGENILEIQRQAFQYCTNLTSVELTHYVSSIGDGAFLRCDKMESITVPFVGSGSGSTFFGIIFGAYNASENGSYIPDSLKTVTVLTGAAIDDDAFLGCDSITSVTLPRTISAIGARAFRGCSALQTISFGQNSNLQSVGESAFENCINLLAVELPAGVTEIGEYAFFECYSLESVNIPAGVTEIQDYTFASCSSLSEITIHEGITSIGLYAFGGCSETEISFVLSSGWSCAHWSTPTDYTALSPDDLADSSIATAYLSTTYVQYEWKRED